MNIEDRIKQGEEGRKLWEHLLNVQKEEGVPHFLGFLLFLGENPALEALALDYLKKPRQDSSGWVLLCMEGNRFVDDFSKIYLSFCKIVLSGEEIESLLCFYQLYQFTEQLKILSLTRPYGTKRLQLYQKGVSLEAIMHQCILNQ